MDKDLAGRIASAKSKLAKPSSEKPDQSGAARFVSELVAGLIVGGGIGWLLDEWLNTSPWLFIVFIVIGMIAAFWNMIRLASADEIGHIGRD